MDTSGQYIKMCDCPEIQEGWKPKQGDYFHGTSITNGGSVKKENATDIIYICGDSWYTIGPSYWEYDDEEFEDKGGAIWLPRQDQLQELCGLSYSALIVQFMAWVENSSDGAEDSFEQLWLAFYMLECHNKRWNDEKGNGYER